MLYIQLGSSNISCNWFRRGLKRTHSLLFSVVLDMVKSCTWHFSTCILSESWFWLCWIGVKSEFSYDACTWTGIWKFLIEFLLEFLFCKLFIQLKQRLFILWTVELTFLCIGPEPSSLPKIMLLLNSRSLFYTNLWFKIYFFLLFLVREICIKRFKMTYAILHLRPSEKSYKSY